MNVNTAHHLTSLSGPALAHVSRFRLPTSNGPTCVSTGWWCRFLNRVRTLHVQKRICSATSSFLLKQNLHIAAMVRVTSVCICAVLLCIAAAANVSAQGSPPPSLPPPNLDGNAGVFSGFNESAYKCVAVL